MGIYISLDIVNLKKEPVATLCKIKGGLGDKIMLFSKFNCNIEKDTYFYINSIQEALTNIDKILVFISQNIKDDNFYDGWSLDAIEKVMIDMIELRNQIQKYKDNPNYSVYADYKEALAVYYDRPHELNPSEFIANRKKHIKNLLDGVYNDMYLSHSEQEYVNNIKSEFIKKIEERKCFKGIEASLGDKYAPKLITIGNYKLMKFIIDFQVDSEFENTLLKVKKELAPINDILECGKFGYEFKCFEKMDDKVVMTISFMKVLEAELKESNLPKNDIEPRNDKDKNTLIKKLSSMGVSEIKGKNPYSMPIEELKDLCDWFENKQKEIQHKKVI